MYSVRFVWICLLACVFGCALQAVVSPKAAGAAAQMGPLYASAERDGQHDFDFHFGTWKTHISKLRHSTTGSPTWVTLDGTVVVRKIWDGRANLEEVEADGAAGHFEDLALFLYNPQAHQWSITFAGSNDGTLGFPSSIGEFKNGRGEFFDQEIRNGKSILVRMIWSKITPNSHHYEQAFSSDGGRTWETNFAASLTREAPAVAKAAAGRLAGHGAGTDPDGQDAFDFGLGTWKEHTVRLLHPLTGSKTWMQMDGVSVDKPIWNGRANIVELESDGPTGHLELLSLRLYNPRSREWNLYFATSQVGIVSGAMTGAFNDGRGEFFSEESVKGRGVLVRFTVTKVAANSERSEQAFSADGGKTWEVNWINTYTRIQGPSPPKRSI
jgi:hypothetical protein